MGGYGAGAQGSIYGMSPYMMQQQQWQYPNSNPSNPYPPAP